MGSHNVIRCGCLFFLSFGVLKMDNEILIEGNICKSISGQEDENGNYIFEVEASNENLDLQNQRTLQSALMKSNRYSSLKAFMV